MVLLLCSLFKKLLCCYAFMGFFNLISFVPEISPQPQQEDPKLQEAMWWNRMTTEILIKKINLSQVRKHSTLSIESYHKIFKLTIFKYFNDSYEKLYFDPESIWLWNWFLVKFPIFCPDSWFLLILLPCTVHATVLILNY